MAMNNITFQQRTERSLIPEKCKDPRTFTVPCIISNNRNDNAMLDLGASINVMPLSIFTSLSLGPLQPTSMVIQLANRSIRRPSGIVEDVKCPSVEQLPTLELKPLPECLKYAYLESGEKLPVMISTKLDVD
ncbi:uncharacterized protein LOC113859421 [Abrus precatorius]|uniref:Uncharacterized protein LOC113859421 n=1 Tax=Abrus precatorius TaxID=3816 RepID=A0A8B8KVS9_ABRPR|nr:uncharacterized protein LOC113859421 [Abrus precatorius]